MESNEELLIKSREEELAKLRKLRLVLKELKSVDPLKLSVIDREPIENAIKIIKIGDFIHLNEKKDQFLLNLQSMCNVNLNYTERKAVRNELSKRLQSSLETTKQFYDKLQNEIPDIFTNGNPFIEEFTALEEQRRTNLEKLAELRNRKCMFLKMAAELKMGPYLGYELDLACIRAGQNQTKVNVLRGYFMNELLTRTDHSLKALREVEGFINKELEKENDIGN